MAMKSLYASNDGRTAVPRTLADEVAGTMTADVHTATTWSIVVSVLMIAAGVLAICVPLIAGVTVTTIAGWLLVWPR
jgi:uncharacterized membrane protein HdeD (DUF308 family)